MPYKSKTKAKAERDVANGIVNIFIGIIICAWICCFYSIFAYDFSTPIKIINKQIDHKESGCKCTPK